jgi:hypothetical protein
MAQSQKVNYHLFLTDQVYGSTATHKELREAGYFHTTKLIALRNYASKRHMLSTT